MISKPIEAFSHFIATHPVLLLSARKGRANTVSPVLWYMPIGMDPPMVAVSLKPSSQSFHFVRESGDFILGVVGESLVKETHFCGVHSGRDVDKLRVLNLTTTRAKTVTPLMITECLVQIECRVRDIIPGPGRPLITAEVLYVGVHEQIDQIRWQPEEFLLYYMGGNRYRVGRKILDMSDVRPGYVPPDAYLR
ncbi:MAG: flavin reductase family protein [Candidatus Hinthialibacter antarcticus]|nr:flavin reductase family protein [Candidatus Hinthialibacter antarcticus]